MNPHAEGQGRGNPESLAATQACVAGIRSFLRSYWFVVLICIVSAGAMAWGK